MQLGEGAFTVGIEYPKTVLVAIGAANSLHREDQPQDSAVMCAVLITGKMTSSLNGIYLQNGIGIIQPIGTGGIC